MRWPSGCLLADQKKEPRPANWDEVPSCHGPTQAIPYSGQTLVHNTSIFYYKKELKLSYNHIIIYMQPLPVLNSLRLVKWEGDRMCIKGGIHHG